MTRCFFDTSTLKLQVAIEMGRPYGAALRSWAPGYAGRPGRASAGKKSAVEPQVDAHRLESYYVLLQV